MASLPPTAAAVSGDFKAGEGGEEPPPQRREDGTARGKADQQAAISPLATVQ